MREAIKLGFVVCRDYGRRNSCFQSTIYLMVVESWLCHERETGLLIDSFEFSRPILLNRPFLIILFSIGDSHKVNWFVSESKSLDIRLQAHFEFHAMKLKKSHLILSVYPTYIFSILYSYCYDKIHALPVSEFKRID